MFVKGQELGLHLLSESWSSFLSTNPPLTLSIVYHCTVVEVELYLQTVVISSAYECTHKFKDSMNACCICFSSPHGPYMSGYRDCFARIGGHVDHGFCVLLHLEFYLSCPFTVAYLKALKMSLLYNWSAGIFYG